MEWKTYKKEFEKTVLTRYKTRVVQAGKGFKLRVITQRPKKQAEIKTYQMAKSAWYYKELFERKLPKVTNFDNIVLAGIEFAILSLLAKIAQLSTNMDSEKGKDSKLLMIYFDFFLAQSSFIYLANQQDSNIDQKFQNYWNLLENIRGSTSSAIEIMMLAHFDNTFNATLVELEPLVRGIVHDNTNAHDHLLRFELIHDALCHVHKHNIRDVYVDMLRKDRLFITADDYLAQANDTKNNGEVWKHVNSFKFYFADNEVYSQHNRITFIEEDKIGRKTVYYLASYFKQPLN